VAALLQIEHSSLDLFGAVHFIRSGHPLVLSGIVQNCGIFSAPHSSSSSQSLDNLLLMFGPIWRKANSLLANPLIGSTDLYLLKDEVMALDRDFATWQRAQVNDFKPRTVSHVTQEQAASNRGVGYWPGRVDTYFDLYVAGVWNTSRTARFLLINLILSCQRYSTTTKTIVASTKMLSVLLRTSLRPFRIIWQRISRSSSKTWKRTQRL